MWFYRYATAGDDSTVIVWDQHDLERTHVLKGSVCCDLILLFFIGLLWKNVTTQLATITLRLRERKLRVSLV